MRTRNNRIFEHDINQRQSSHNLNRFQNVYGKCRKT